MYSLKNYEKDFSFFRLEQKVWFYHSQTQIGLKYFVKFHENANQK